MSGFRLVIGVRIDDGQVPDAGAAYVFERDAEGGWRQTQKLTAADTGAVYVCTQTVADDASEMNAIDGDPGIETAVGILAGVVAIRSGTVAAGRYLRDRETVPGS